MPKLENIQAVVALAWRELEYAEVIFLPEQVREVVDEVFNHIAVRSYELGRKSTTGSHAQAVMRYTKDTGLKIHYTSLNAAAADSGIKRLAVQRAIKTGRYTRKGYRFEKIL